MYAHTHTRSRMRPNPGAWLCASESSVAWARAVTAGADGTATSGHGIVEYAPHDGGEFTGVNSDFLEGGKLWGIVVVIMPAPKTAFT